MLDELIIAGELQESSKKAVLRVCAAQDALMEEGKDKDEGLYHDISQLFVSFFSKCSCVCAGFQMLTKYRNFTVYKKKYRANHYE